MDIEGKFHSEGLLSLVKELFGSQAFRSFVFESYLLLNKMRNNKVPLSLAQVGEEISSVHAIHWSCFFQLPEITLWLLNQDRDCLNYVSRFGSPIHCATSSLLIPDATSRKCGNEILRILLEQGADVNQFGTSSQMRLFECLWSSPPSIAKMLLDAGFICSREMLFLPSRSKVLDSIEPKHVLDSDKDLLFQLKNGNLKSGRDPRTRIQIVSSPESSPFETLGQRLLRAVKCDRLAEAMSLIGKNADVDTVDFEGCTPLHYAVSQNNLEIVRALIAAGADLHKPNRNGLRPSVLVAKHGAGRILSLIFVTSDLYLHRDDTGRTPLHIAAYHGNRHLVQEFAKDTWNIERMSRVDFEGFTPFLIAAQAGQLLMINEFLQCLPTEHLNMTTADGRTALHLACSSGSASAISILLKKSFDPNKTTSKGSTALHSAMATKNWSIRMDIVDLLLTNGADPLVLDCDGNSPLHLLPSISIQSQVRNIGITPPVINLLTRSSSMASVRNSYGQMPIHMATSSHFLNSLPWLKLYLDSGHDMFTEDNKGRTSCYMLFSSYLRTKIQGGGAIPAQ